jgi:hypothetical protein
VAQNHPPRTHRQTPRHPPCSRPSLTTSTRGARSNPSSSTNCSMPPGISSAPAASRPNPPPAHPPTFRPGNHDGPRPLGRYQARAQRASYRVIQELRTLQTNRALRAVKLDEEEVADVPTIADINELTKQTRSEVTAEASNWRSPWWTTNARPSRPTQLQSPRSPRNAVHPRGVGASSVMRECAQDVFSRC